MKLCLVYFEENNDRHINNKILSFWIRIFEKSKTNLEPVIITDDSTIIPHFWNYGYKRVKIKNRFDKILHKVGFLKHKAFDLFGKCLVLDLDAFVVSSLDEFKDYDHSFGMAMDFNTFEKKWWFYDTWPECKFKHNAGFMLFNDKLISKMFEKIWNEKFNLYREINFLDELVFSEIKNILNGKTYDIKYNSQYVKQCTKVVHFSGKKNKNKMNLFLSSFFLE